MLGLPLLLWDFIEKILVWAEHAEFISSHWKEIMNFPSWFGWLAPIVGLGLIAWDILDRRRKPRHKDEYLKETVLLSDLILDGTPIISGKKFIKCHLVGPGYLKAQTQNNFEFCFVSNNPEQHFQSLPEGNPISGAILLSRNIFEKCFFENITFVGTVKDTETILPAFSQMPLSEWKAKYFS
jgi:hypothetical protein